MIKRYRAKPIPPKFVLIIGLSLVLILMGGIYLNSRNSKPVINDFESCAEAGNPVAESFPEQCFHNGRGFVKEY